MKKIVALLALSSSLFAYNTYEAPFEGTKCITQGWKGTYSHGDIILGQGNVGKIGDKYPYALDISGSFEVLSPAKGTVVKVYKDDTGEKDKKGNKFKDTNAGNTVIIKFEDGLYGQFIHLAYGKIYVKEKDQVLAGTPIAMSGNTGKWSIGNHLHMQFSTVQEFATKQTDSKIVTINGWNGKKELLEEINSRNCLKEYQLISQNKKNTATPSTPSLTTPSNGSSVSGVNIKLAWTNPNELKTHRWIISTDKLFIDGLKNDTDWEKECKNQKTKCYTSQVSDKKTPASTETGNLGLTTKNDTTYYWKVRSNTDMSPTGNFIISKITSIGISCSPTIIKAGGKGKCIATANYDIKSKVNPENITINSGTSWSIKNNSTLLKIGLKDGKFNAMKVGTAKIVVNYLDATANGQEIKVTENKNC